MGDLNKLLGAIFGDAAKKEAVQFFIGMALGYADYLKKDAATGESQTFKNHPKFAEFIGETDETLTLTADQKMLASQKVLNIALTHLSHLGVDPGTLSDAIIEAPFLNLPPETIAHFKQMGDRWREIQRIARGRGREGDFFDF